ncbi:MAG TPA: ferredoxin reductase family protein [Chloroflexota bacterium]
MFLANAAVIVWLWLNGGGVSAVHSWATLLTSLGRITGLLGAYLLLVQVLLIARLRFLESLAGFDRLTIWHRLNGKVCLYLILAHVVLITVGYTLTDRISIGAEISALLGSYPGMVTATIGTALIVLVVVTSFVIVRQRIRYEAWYLVHLLTYLGILLSWFHQLPTGNEFITNPTASSYWTGLYLVTLALLVVYRLMQPTLSNLRFRMRVAEVVPEGQGVVSIRISGRNLQSLNARAGQFFLWRFLTWTRWWESHPFSLSEAPGGRSLRITVKDSGDFSGAIGSIKPGTLLVAEGPFGVFTDAVRRREKVALFAGGIGITPVRALVEDMPGDLALVYRVIREEDIVFGEELEQLARRRGFALHLVVGHHAAPGGERLMSPEHLTELIPDIAEREVYVCGPPRMADYIEKNVEDAGVSRKYIHIERFAL